jgi:soluble lytic murein transglycosylase-like protein
MPGMGGPPETEKFTCGSSFTTALIVLVALSGSPAASPSDAGGHREAAASAAFSDQRPEAGAAAILAPEPSAAPASASWLEEVTVDTVRHVVPRLFERRVLFSTEYLGRILEASSQRNADDTPAVAASEEARIATYSRRYGISSDLARDIIDSALEEGLDPELAFLLVRVASLFRPTARGPSGALGLTQLMPSTARSIDRSLRTEAQILEPGTNLRTGFRYLRRMIERYDGDVRLGLLAYNRGSTAVDRALQAGRDPENGYSSKVLGTGNARYKGRGLVVR